MALYHREVAQPRNAQPSKPIKKLELSEELHTHLITVLEADINERQKVFDEKGGTPFKLLKSKVLLAQCREL